MAPPVAAETLSALLLRLLTFPLGIPGPGPSDRLGHQVAAILLAPSALRDRLTAGIYTPSDLGEPLGRLDDALHKVIAAEAVEKKLRDAVKGKQIVAGSDEQMLQDGVQAGVITAGEAGIVAAAQAARQEVEHVVLGLGNHPLHRVQVRVRREQPGDHPRVLIDAEAGQVSVADMREQAVIGCLRGLLNPLRRSGGE